MNKKRYLIALLAVLFICLGGVCWAFSRNNTNQENFSVYDENASTEDALSNDNVSTEGALSNNSSEESNFTNSNSDNSFSDSSSPDTFTSDDIPEYTDKPTITVNGNLPYFTAEDKELSYSDIILSDLDEYGRCHTAIGCLGQENLPTFERGDISSVHPAGWQSTKYDNINGKNLYNRSHLLAFSLTGMDSEPRNLITGTQFLNHEGMLPYENMIANYIDESTNHVLYRVTPIYHEANLIPTGVLMEAYSVEDQGKDLHFCIFVYNIQPGIDIDYRDGSSSTNSNYEAAYTKDKQADWNYNFSSDYYILNSRTKKFHFIDCDNVSDIGRSNLVRFYGARQEIIDMGYVPCKNCNP